MTISHRATKLALGAVVAALGLAACSQSGNSSGSVTTPSGAFGSVPAASGTAHAGTITWAEQPGAPPNYIFPVTPSADSGVTTAYDFQYEMWRPLYWYVNGVNPTETPSMSLANPPTYSNGDKTVTITLKTNYKWSDGQPLTSKDVLFFIDEVRAAVKESGANWSQYTPQVGIPDQVVSGSTPNSTTLVLKLNKPVNPTWFTEDELQLIQPMPVHVWAKASANGPVLDFTNPANAKKIYDFLAQESGSTGTYATNPLWKVVDGPYKLTSFNNTTGAYTMAPNPAYGGPTSAKVPILQAVPYTSDTAEFNAVLAHGVDLGYLPQTDVPQLSAVEKAGYHVFGYPDWGFTYVNYNFADKTGDFNNIIRQLYVRQALAHLEDEEGYVKAFFHGAGGLAYGPVPAVPVSPYTPANAIKNPYPFSVSAASSLLKSHGWNVVPGGTSTCAKPGTGAGECGAGIPAGTKLTFNVLYSSDPAIIGEQLTNWSSEAKKVGIDVVLKSDTFNHVIDVADDPGSPKTINDWAMADYGGFTNETYPTTFGIFSTGGSFNGGFWNDPTTNKLINASVTGGNPAAVKAEASYITKVQPSLFQPNPDFIIVWKDNVSGQPAAIKAMTQYQLNPELMYLKS
ncbi:MAG TPA: ABC transporter substrate-binding protein [Streptosporangiaceae bacterium]|nr:ABC transporter substrate-binding protein [Streptosporangiaceae bacterium]